MRRVSCPETAILELKRNEENKREVKVGIVGAQAYFGLSAVAGIEPGIDFMIFGSEAKLRFVKDDLLLQTRDDTEFKKVTIPDEDMGGWRVEEEFITDSVKPDCCKMNLKTLNTLTASCKRRTLVPALVVVTCGWFIYLLNINKMGGSDWSLFYGAYEVIRRTIFEYGQFPFWNPWQCGGTPLYAHPEIGVFSLETLFSLFTNPVTGLNLAMFVYVLIGSIGMYFFLSDYSKQQLTLYWGTVLFGLQGPIMMHLSKGHTVMLVMCWFPWILFLVRRIKHSFWFAFSLGVIFSIIINTAIHYVTVIIFIFSFFLLLSESYRNLVDRNKTFFINFIVVILVFFTCSIYRIILSYSLFSEYPRIISTRENVPVWMFLTGLVYPFQHGNSFPPGPLAGYWAWHEIGSYVGIIAVIMFLVSFFKEVKWWQIVCVLTFPLVVNSTSKFLPGYWLRELPIFSSMFCITRWRFFTVFFLILSACRGFDFFCELSANRKWIRTSKLPFILIIVSTAGLLVHSFYNWSHCAWSLKEKVLASVPISSKTIANSDVKYDLYAAYSKGIGVLRASEPLLGYGKNKKTRRMFVENKLYKGELVSVAKNGVVAMHYQSWSPNKLVINCEKPCCVVINQNPGNYWQINGSRPFENLRSFAPGKNFVVSCPERITMEVSIVPPWHRIALNLTLLFLSILILYVYFSRRKPDRKTIDSHGPPGLS